MISLFLLLAIIKINQAHDTSQYANTGNNFDKPSNWQNDDRCQSTIKQHCSSKTIDKVCSNNRKRMVTPSDLPTVDSSDSCPCVKLDGTNKCFTYDDRNMAMTLEEAFERFRDPTSFIPHDARPIGHCSGKKSIGNWPTLQKMLEQASSEERRKKRKLLFPELDDANCRKDTDSCKDSVSCRACAKKILVTMRQALNKINNELANGIRAMINSTWSSFELNNIDEAACGDQSLSPAVIINEDTGDWLKSATSDVSVQISCDYVRGQPVDANSGYCSLCNLCWQFRFLQSNYIPHIINERACSTDTRCLAGYGQCRPKYILRSLAYNTGKSYIETTLNSVLDCECQVSQSSGIYSFVVA